MAYIGEPINNELAYKHDEIVIPKMKKSFIIILLPLLSLLLGCQQFLDIKADDELSLQPVFHFYYHLDLHSPPRSVKVSLHQFTVYRKSGNGTSVVVWDIEAYSARIGDKLVPQPDMLKGLRYGVAPPGFRTITPAEPLAWNTTYQARAALSVPEKQGVVGAGGEFKPIARE